MRCFVINGFNHSSEKGPDCCLKNAHFIEAQETNLKSHLECLRCFVHTGDSHGLIIEENVLLHIDYSVYLKDLKDFDIVLLGYLIDKDPGKFGTFHSKFKNVSLYDYPEFFWGSSGYVISREYALKILDTVLDEPLEPEQFITKYTENRVFMYPPLVIDNSDKNWFHKSCKDFLYNNNYKVLTKVKS